MPDSEPRVLFHHIGSKSAWRMKLEVPRRPGMVTVVLEGLPRSGPFRVAAGREAFRAARAAMKRALDTKIADGVVIAA
jgi:NTE family protein